MATWPRPSRSLPEHSEILLRAPYADARKSSTANRELDERGHHLADESVLA